MTTSTSSNATGHTTRGPRLGEALARAEGRKAPATVMPTNAGQPAVAEKKYHWPPGVGKKNLNGAATLQGGRSGAAAKAYCRHLVTAAAHWRLAHPGKEFDFQTHFRDQETITQSMPPGIDDLYAHMRRHATHTHYLSMEQFGDVIDRLRRELTPKQPEHVTFLRLGGHALMLSIRDDRIALFDPNDTHREARINLVPGQPSDVKLQDLLTDEQLGKYFKRIPGIMIHLLQPAEHDYAKSEKDHQKNGTYLAQHEVTFHCDLSAPLLRALLYDAHYVYAALTDVPFTDKLDELALSTDGADKLRDMLAGRFDDKGQKNWHPYLKSFVQGTVDGSHGLVDVLSYMAGNKSPVRSPGPHNAILKAAVVQANLPAAWELEKLDVASMMAGKARDPFVRLMGVFAQHAPAQLSDTLCARVVAELTGQLSAQIERADKLDVAAAIIPNRTRSRHREPQVEAFFPFSLGGNRGRYPTIEDMCHFIAEVLQRPARDAQHAHHLDTLARATLRGLQMQFDVGREGQYRKYLKAQHLTDFSEPHAHRFTAAALQALIGPLAAALPDQAQEIHALVARRQATVDKLGWGSNVKTFVYDSAH